MRRLRRLFFHHQCQVCGRTRPIWMRGEHTRCLEYRLREMAREDLSRRGRLLSSRKFLPESPEEDR